MHNKENAPVNPSETSRGNKTRPDYFIPPAPDAVKPVDSDEKQEFGML